MKRYQIVVKSLTHGKNGFASSDHLRIFFLGKINLILDHFHHRSPRCQKIHRRKHVRSKESRNPLRLSGDCIVIGAGAVKNIDPGGIMPLQQFFSTFFKRISHFYVHTDRQPLCQKIAAKCNALLPISLNLGISLFQCYMGINKISAHKVSLCAHNRFCTLSVSVCNLVIMRHTLVHLFQLFVKVSAFPVKHHKYRWGAKRPASVTSDTDGRSCHLLAGTAVKLTHSRNIIVHKKALDQIAFAQKISSLFLRQLWMFSDGCQKKFFQFQHFGNIFPVKHASHKNQNCKRIFF